MSNQKTIRNLDEQFEAKEIERAFVADMCAARMTEADIRNIADGIAKKLCSALQKQKIGMVVVRK